MKEKLKATTKRMIPVLAQIVQRYLPGYNAVEWQIWAAMIKNYLPGFERLAIGWHPATIATTTASVA